MRRSPHDVVYTPIDVTSTNLGKHATATYAEGRPVKIPDITGCHTRTWFMLDFVSGITEVPEMFRCFLCQEIYVLVCNPESSQITHGWILGDNLDVLC